MRLITSRQNETVKLLKALAEPHSRKKHGAFLLEGYTLVAEALSDAPQNILLIVLTPSFADTARGKEILANAARNRTSVVLLEQRLFEEVVPSETPQGVLAVLKEPPRAQLQGLSLSETAQVVVLEGVQDPSNVGAIVRIADAVGAAAVLCVKGTADPYAPKAVRASAGSVLHLPVLLVESIAEVITWLRNQGCQIVATVPEGGINLFAAEFSERVAVLVGNEGHGLSAEAKKAADLLVTVPMFGRTQSLNVAVATAVVLYEIVRRFQVALSSP